MKRKSLAVADPDLAGALPALKRAAAAAWRLSVETSTPFYVIEEGRVVDRNAAPKKLSMPTYLLTWNPQSWPWDDLPDEARRLRRGKSLEGRWGCGHSRSLKPGDRFFFLRQGRPPRGIIASGR